MSVVSAVVNHFDNGGGTSLTTLRNLVSGGCWAYEAPASSDMPYIVVNLVSNDVVTQETGNASRIDRVVVQLTTWHSEAAVVESILDAVEDAYLDSVLTDSRYTILSFPIRGSRDIFRDDDLFQGWLELIYTTEKSPIVQ